MVQIVSPKRYLYHETQDVTLFVIKAFTGITKAKILIWNHPRLGMAINPMIIVLLKETEKRHSYIKRRCDKETDFGYAAKSHKKCQELAEAGRKKERRISPLGL